ncbi:5'-3' exoribonuclease 3 [Abeliophyllum distichum]|uniref:5'-3' exoribonuclease n=1 Tax=Abeliophyllum distichum TaxID=126358 RepID=A0ABD1U0D7_9LAMI
MGVPSFYRWLVNKYPKIVVDAIEEKGEFIDNNLQNKNGEFDNFYIDMNGIIHPCFHPDDQLFGPTTFDEVVDNICRYIDRLFNIVRPRKLLYLAIDGVAPRAKMNQQRARRFRASKDNQLAEEMEETLRKQFEKEGKPVLPKEESQVSDSNVITPGTEFMYTLSKKLESYIRQQMSSSAAWSNIKVILSDANVPGEGEHKIMSFIRAQRLLPDYNANTHHCLYGLDADLIMLALATHEMYFSIIREDLLVQEEPLCRVSALEHTVHRAEVLSLEKSSVLDEAGQTDNKRSMQSSKRGKPYQFLHVWVLREYLELDMEITNPPENFVVEFERIVDDFIFICFFAGNDFLPHVPSLEIHEGSVGLLMHVYKKEFKKIGGYLVDVQQSNEKNARYIKPKRVEKFILYVGQYEDQIFTKRSRLRDKKLRQILSDSMDDEKRTGKEIRANSVTSDTFFDVNPVSSQIDQQSVDNSEILRNTKELKQKLKDQIRGLADTFKNGGLGTDKVKLGVPGWKERYYKEKFSAESPGDIETTRKEVVRKYGEGLCWVILYYFSGVPSWTWFYPYHYAPFASDFKGLSQLQVNFQKGLPFKPFDQLMGVLPPRSAHSLPGSYKGLMIDDSSKIIDFYPAEFETDIDGKRYMWQAISKLPFIDEERLLTETVKVQKELKDFEIMRNTENPDKLFVRSSSKFGREIISCCGSFSVEEDSAIKIDSILSERINSCMHLISEDSNLAEVDNEDYECTPTVLCVLYETPPHSRPIPKLLPGVKIPDYKTVYEADILETKLWHENWGSNSHYRQRVHYQERPRKVNSQVGSKQSVPGVIYNEAGTGFSFGRGKNSARDSQWHGNFPGHAVCRPLDRNSSPFPYDARVPMVSSRGSYTNSRIRNVQPSVTNHSIHGDIGSLRISSAPMNNNFWPSNATSSSYAGNYSRLHNHPTASPHGQVWRGWQQVSMENTSQNWRHNQSMSTNYTARGGYQRMSTENTSQTWQHYQSTSTNFTARGGQQRMSTENTNQRWQHYQSTPTNSMARGGQQRMSTDNTSQTWRHPMSTNSTAGNGRGRGFP